MLLLRRADGGRASPKLCRGVFPDAAYPQIKRFPLQMPKAPSGALEGYPAIAEYRIRGTVRNDYQIELRVDIRDPNPDRELRQRAQRALTQLRLPDWPNRC